jgi:hypothetical protein
LIRDFFVFFASDNTSLSQYGGCPRGGGGAPKSVNKKRDPIGKFPAGSDFEIKTGSRFANENRGSFLK